jgi:hypothetical protein
MDQVGVADIRDVNTLRALAALNLTRGVIMSVITL